MKTRLLLFTLLICFFYSNSQITITLRKSFVDSFKNKVTIAANYEVYFAHPHPNTGAKDGDLHFAGFDKKIGLPIVAEIMNAKEFDDAVKVVHDFEGKGKPDKKVNVTGVWRLWCEHPGDIEAFKQGKMKIEIENTNPAHVFEIHPITKIDTIDVARSLHKISGFKYKDAEDAFGRYSNLRCKIRQTAKTVTIETNGIGYNYVNFWLKFNSSSNLIVSDGLFGFCTIFNSDFDPNDDDQGDLISHKMRIAFVKGSELYEKAKAAKKGDLIHVVGIPRISLVLISWRAANASQRPEVVNWNLPFELVAVGELN